jgi:serine protease Do
MIPALLGLLSLVLVNRTIDEPPAVLAPADLIAAAQQRVVKLYGGGLGREKGYGSGVLVSSDGLIVTTTSILLEASTLRAVLFDGRRLSATVVRTDDRRQLALLKIDATDLPFFELGPSGFVQPGDWVLAAANPFKVAEGPEPVSISIGVLSARTTLDARRRAQDFPYDGPVLLTDVITATPGSAGGALVHLASGRLIGVIGKTVVSNRTNTWANYAMPAEEIAAFVSTAAPPGESDAAGHAAAPTREFPATSGDAAARRALSAELGLRLFDIGGQTRPAYVERVRPGSPAHAAGLRPDDLILSLDGVSIATCEDFRNAVARLRPGQRIQVVFKRGEQVMSVELSLEDARR